MHRLSCTAALSLLLASAASLAATPPPSSAAAEPTVVTEVAEITATVTRIDLANRLVTLRGPEGNYAVVEVDPAVKRLNEIRAGDKLKVKFSRAVALNVVKTEGPLKTTFDPVPTVKKDTGAFPGGTAHQTATSTVRIEAIDLEHHTVAFTEDKVGLQTITVREPKVQEYLKTLNKGDVVKIVYTEAVAVAIAPAEAKN